MRRLFALVLMASLLVVVGPAGEAEACSCALPDPTTALEQSDAAFIGTLLERPDPIPAPGQTTAIWVFQVDEWIKGDLGEQVGVHSGFGGGDCGFEIAADEQTGVFLHNDGRRPSGGLCSTTSPEAMRAAGQPLVFDGVGPPVFLIATDTGRTRLATLDARGRLIAALGDDRFGWSVSVCPGHELLVDVVEGEVTVRDLNLETVRAVEPPAAGRVEQVWCLDADGERILGQVWNETGTIASLRILGGEMVHEGEEYLLDVSPSRIAFVTHPAAGSLDVIDLATNERSRIGPATNVGTLAFSPSGEKLLITEVIYHDDGGYETHATVYSAATGDVVWTSPPLVDSSIYDWVDEHRLAGDRYPIQAEAGIGLIFDIDDGTIVELDATASYQAVGDSLVSVSEAGLAVTGADGATTLLAPLPTPTHRLVAVLDPDIVLDVPGTDTTTTTPEPEPVATASEELPEAGFPTAVALTAGAGVALILAVGWRAIRRRRA